MLFFAADSESLINSVTIAGTITGSVSFPVPEPASVLFLLLAAPALLKTRGRKS